MAQTSQSGSVVAGLLLIAAAALLAALIGGGIAAGAVTLIGGGTALFVARGRAAPVPPAPVIAPPRPVTSTSSRAVAAIGEAIADPLLVTVDGRVVEANAAARALLGEHILGEDVRLAIRHPAAAERLADPAGDSQPIDLVGLTADDQRWQMHVSALIDGCRAIHLVDQTARYAAERMRVDFVANASHELKTPLASVLGYIETLNDEAAGSDAGLRARFLRIMAGEATRMQRLVEDLISLSRIEAEKYRLPAAAVDLGELTESIVHQLTESGNPRADDLVFEPAAGLPPVNGDRAQLSQLLYNLIGNAMKYGKAGTPVTVRTELAGPHTARLTVSDCGEGIAPEHVPRLTERFYRADPSRSRSLGGTGLGLAIVKHIVERHRGQLDITSRLGKGTTVTVRLPLFAGNALSSKSHLSVTRADAVS
ncbi:MAG: sensor histidine kinase [Sphingomonas sp.]